MKKPRELFSKTQPDMVKNSMFEKWFESRYGPYPSSIPIGVLNGQHSDAVMNEQCLLTQLTACQLYLENRRIALIAWSAARLRTEEKK